ncbi:MAG: zinc-binding dehydrogenase [Bacillota bacterium]|nr:zinc-binding dehydrogenase [Bacillota bacterium]
MKTRMLMVTGRGRIEMVPRELPELGDHGVLLKVLKSLVSPGTERAYILGLANTPDNYPIKSGYSAVSQVLETGPAVTAFRPGDRVAGFHSAHQNYDVQPADSLVKVPDAVDDEQAAFGAIGLIAMQGVRKARLELGESCAVIGMGPVGQVALQIAAASGAWPLVAVDKAENRLELARRCVTCTTISDCAQVPAASMDVVIDATGYPDAVPSALDMAAQNGRVVLLGSTRGDCSINVYRDIHRKGLSLIGAHVNTVPRQDRAPGRWIRLDDLSVFYQLLERKKIDLTPLITDRYDNADIIEAYERRILSWDPTAVGVIFNW